MESKDLQKRLQMDHLPKLEDLKEEAKAAIEPPAKPPVHEDNPKLKKECTFDFKWTDGRGKEWAGEFTNHILNMREQQMVGIMEAKLIAGMPRGSVDPDKLALNMAISHMTYSLSDDRPDWAKNLHDILDMQLIGALWLEVSSHEDTFFGRQVFTVEGSSKP